MINHWIIESLGKKKLEGAIKIANKYLVSSSLNQICDNNNKITTNEIKIIQNAIDALEFMGTDLHAAAFDLKENKREERSNFHECCKLAFFLLRVLPLPYNEIEKSKQILRLISFAYLGQRWADIKRWLDEHNEAWEIGLNKSAEWDKRLFGTIYNCWLHLIRKNNWKDLNNVADNIVSLRKEQKVYENNYLKEPKSTGDAWELVSLYHWAKATELLSEYMLQGTPKDILEQLDFHFEKSIFGSQSAFLIEMEVLLRWLHLSAKQMALNSLWMVANRVNSRVSTYIKLITKASRPMFELLPPQRVAILEQGLLTPTHKAVVVDMPTSSGKTALAEFRILQALNQFQNGWVAYIVPTRALVNQICARLKRNLGQSPLNIKVAKMCGAIEIDGFEDAMISEKSDFEVLVTTPEKLDLLIRDGIEKRMARPLALVVLDEAHNLSDEVRGLKIELLLAIIRKECDYARFLLLTPYIPNGEDIANWLDPSSPGTISLGLSWQPNDRVVGYVYPVKGKKTKDWQIFYKTLMTSHHTIDLEDNISFGEKCNQLDLNWSKINKNKTLITAAISNIFKERGSVIAVARKIKDSWNLARSLYNNSQDIEDLDERVKLVQRFIEAEMGEDFELIRMLNRGIGVHHSGLSDEVRFLIEWLTEEGLIKALVATTTIAQGINFPVSSVFLASLSYPWREMPKRDFWNLAGRAGRFDHGTLGVVGIASKSDATDIDKIVKFVKEAGEDLVSTLLNLYYEIINAGKKLNLEEFVYMPQWSAFVQYIAHIYRQCNNLNDFTTNTEMIMRHTYGYQCLKKQDPKAANAIIMAVKEYASKLSQKPALATLADQTGFSPEAVNSAIGHLKGLGLKKEVWNTSSLFKGDKNVLKNLIGVMLTIPEVKDNLKKVSDHGLKHENIASITQDWVNGVSMEKLAKKYFMIPEKKIDFTTALSDCCSAIYGKLINSATWGIASIQKLPNSGIDFDKLNEEEKRIINNLPAMIYYGVSSEEALVMRMNSVPRSISENLGGMFKKEKGKIGKESPKIAGEWLDRLSEKRWNNAVPSNVKLSGRDYQQIWKKLNGVE